MNVKLRNTVQKFGEGGFGVVEERVDFQNLEIMAVKEYKSSNKEYVKLLYEKERDIYISLENVVGEKIQDSAIMLRSYDDDAMTLYFEPGVCSLFDFM